MILDDYSDFVRITSTDLVKHDTGDDLTELRIRNIFYVLLVVLETRAIVLTR